MRVTQRAIGRVSRERQAECSRPTAVGRETQNPIKTLIDTLNLNLNFNLNRNLNFNPNPNLTGD